MLTSDNTILDHSKAKVQLYNDYLTRYLNILSHVDTVETIHIFDMFCGEGIYADGTKGSPVMALDTINSVLSSLAGTTCPNFELWFNDKDKSELYDGYKIDCVTKYYSEHCSHPNINAMFTIEEYETLYPEILKKLNSLKRSKALLFIDPYGYKSIDITNLKDFLKNGNTEAILFLPMTPMYRFVNKVIRKESFSGEKALKRLISTLNMDTRQYDSLPDFIESLKNTFKRFLRSENRIFVDTFTLQRDSRNTYCLFFFTPNILGFEKMLETKWKNDEHAGKGFRLDNKQYEMFSEIQTSEYPSEVKEYIKSSHNVSNADLYIFGLDKGFLPKHTNIVLKDWQNRDNRFRVYDAKGYEVRKGAFYIKYKNYYSKPEKRVYFRYLNG